MRQNKYDFIFLLKISKFRSKNVISQFLNVMSNEEHQFYTFLKVILYKTVY